MQYIKLSDFKNILEGFVAKGKLKEFKDNFDNLEKKDNKHLELNFRELLASPEWHVYRAYLEDNIENEAEKLKGIEKKDLERAQGFIAGINYVLSEATRFCKEKEEERRRKEEKRLADERAKNPFGYDEDEVSAKEDEADDEDLEHNSEEQDSDSAISE